MATAYSSEVETLARELFEKPDHPIHEKVRIGTFSLASFVVWREIAIAQNTEWLDTLEEQARQRITQALAERAIRLGTLHNLMQQEEEAGRKAGHIGITSENNTQLKTPA